MITCSPVMDFQQLADTSLEALAYEFAANAHAGQTHRDGQPAIEHSYRVARNFISEPELYAIACLHDVLEDCPHIHYGYLAMRFGDRVGRGVLAMTRGKTQSWNSYIRQVKANPDAVRVKIVDIEDNIARADAKFNGKMSMYIETLAQLKSISPLTSSES